MAHHRHQQGEIYRHLRVGFCRPGKTNHCWYGVVWARPFRSLNFIRVPSSKDSTSYSAGGVDLAVLHAGSIHGGEAMEAAA